MIEKKNHKIDVKSQLMQFWNEVHRYYVGLKLWILFKQFYQLCADKKLWQISQMKTN